MPVCTTAGLAHNAACLDFTEMIPNSRGFFFSSALILQIFVSEVFLPSAFLLLKSLNSEEGWEDAAVSQYDRGALCEKQPILLSGKTLNHASTGEKRNPAEVHSATRDGANVELLLGVGL